MAIKRYKAEQIVTLLRQIEVGIADGKPIPPPACNDTAMCANPACNVPFRYFRSGKIFMLEASDVDPRSRTDPPRRRIEHFWLCGECGPAMRWMRTTDAAVTICQPPRPSDPLGALRIAFAREVTWLKAPKV